MIFTLEQAIQYIKEKIATFYAEGRDLVSQRNQARELINSLNMAGQETIEAYEVLRKIEERINSWRSIESMVNPFASFFGIPTNTGLGVAFALPLALLAVAVTTAIALYNYFRGSSDFRAALDLIAQEKLTPQQAATLQTGSSVFAGFNQTLMLALLGGFLLLVMGRR